MYLLARVPTLLFMLWLPLQGHSQSAPPKCRIKTHLRFDGREIKESGDTLAKEQFVSWFHDGKVSVGKTTAQVVSFKVRWLSTRSDYKGPYTVEVTDGANVNQKLAEQLKQTLAPTNRGDEIFIDDIRARKANGDVCKVAHGVTFILR